MEQTSDSILILRLQNDDHDAFNELFNRYWESLYRSAIARLGNNEAVAQDIVQEIFIRIWQRRHTLQINSSLESYLQGSVRLSVISYFRSVKVSEQQLQDALQRMDILESTIANHTDYLAMEKTLEYEVSHMSETLRKIYQLRTENYSIKDIASELGLAEQTVKNYISEVLRRLRIVIKETYPEKYAVYFSIIFALLYKYLT